MKIPIVDIDTFIDGNQKARISIAEQIDHACCNTGFFMIIVNPEIFELIDEVEKTARIFFSLPDADKYVYNRTDSGIGYLPVGTESLVASMGVAAPPDLKETLNLRLGLDLSRWPNKPQNLRNVWEKAIRALNSLARELMCAFALALELPDNFFDNKVNHPKSILRAALYPGIKTDRAVDKLERAGAHTDYGTITILRPERGLQFFSKHDSWVDVPTGIQNSFAINIGDLLARWTNNRWPATLHRVNKSNLSSDRLSIVFLHNPNPETLVECLPTCISPGEIPTYEPVIAGEYLALRSRQSREMLVR